MFNYPKFGRLRSQVVIEEYLSPYLPIPLSPLSLYPNTFL